jgi:3-methylcrotonyl-CoA carboxylase alpha subunit
VSATAAKPPRLARLLVANRGEIVCRIARTARRLGIATLAVYSDADRGARHVRIAEEAYHLGASPAAESYLNVERLIALALRVGADAVHPGYGFLSENAGFAQACGDAGLTFIGPPPAAIRAMGSKSAAKAAMASIGVPVAPGYHGEDQSAPRLESEAARVGFPLIIKASAGGGGKGMQVVDAAAALPAAIDSAKRLARAAFGDDRILLERYFPRARHVEVQIFADAHGTVVALSDRDCSVQRRHQKVVEEAPAPGLRDDVRRDMAQAAIRAARAVGYVSAGTVEFLLDEAQNFYFMEMNTRLQVEHAVTELVTGVDLVEWQLRVARGESLPAAAADMPLRGAAIEARLYAEDPGHDYLPSVGRIEHLRWPAPEDGLRLDSGVDAGDDVSSFYDPMLAKLVAWGATRTEAASRLRGALAQIEIAGVRTNRALLFSILSDPEFERADVDTGFIERRRRHLRFCEPEPGAQECAFAALWFASSAPAAALWGDTGGWRLGAPACSIWRFGAWRVAVERLAADRYRAVVHGPGGEGAGAATPANVHPAERVIDMRLLGRDAASLHVESGGAMQRVAVVTGDAGLHLFRSGSAVQVRLARTEDALRTVRGADEGSLLTPLPGTVVAVHVALGEHVARGAPLITVEAMKMEHTLTAPRAGIVERIPFGLTARVPAGAVLIALANDAAPGV